MSRKMGHKHLHQTELDRCPHCGSYHGNALDDVEVIEHNVIMVYGVCYDCRGKWGDRFKLDDTFPLPGGP